MTNYIIQKGDKMPQMNKGGKFVFGWSIIRDNGNVSLPQMAIEEYKITSEKNVILISGSKRTGGFCVSSKELIDKSSINGLFKEHPSLRDFKTKKGEFVKYKGRLYCWLPISGKGVLNLSKNTLKILSLKIQDKLLSIRGSNVAFVMGVKGPLIEKGNNYKGEIKLY
jgi:hypothetical protein